MGKISFRRGGGVKHPFADWNRLKPELDLLTKQLGHFPTYGELERINRYDVRNAVRDHHGGFVKVQKKMGFQPKKKIGKDSLTIWENYEREIRQVAAILGHFPSTKELIKLKRSDLHATTRQHGGVDAVRTRMGFALGYRGPERSLKKWENFEPEMRAVWQRLGHFPSWTELEKLERQDLLNGLKYHGGIEGVRKKFKVQPLIQRGENSLRIWKNLKAELEPIIRNYGGFPSTTLLAKIGRSDLASAILKHPGGANQVRRKFGFKPLKRTPEESFRKWGNAKMALLELGKKLGHFPTDTELIATGNASLAQAIRDYHGGLRKAREGISGARRRPSEARKLSFQEINAFSAAKKGRDAEKLALIASQEPIIRKWVGIEAAKKVAERKDLRQQAILGVLEALNRSSSAQEFYGTVEKVVKGEVKKLSRKENGLSYSRKERSQIVMIAQTKRRLAKALGREPTIQEISDSTTIPTGQIADLQKRYPRSLFETDRHGRQLISRTRTRA